MIYEEKANMPEPNEQNLILEPVSLTDGLEALSDEELQAQIDLLQQQIDLLKEGAKLNKKRKELDLRALKLGLLKAANATPRYSHVKASGKLCRAPVLARRRSRVGSRPGQRGDGRR